VRGNIGYQQVIAAGTEFGPVLVTTLDQTQNINLSSSAYLLHLRDAENDTVVFKATLNGKDLTVTPGSGDSAPSIAFSLDLANRAQWTDPL